MSSTPLLKLLIRDSTDECPEESSSYTILEEMRCSWDREKLLIEKVKQLEERIAELLPYEFTLKQRDSEVERLESKNKVQGQQVVVLKKEVESVKMRLMLEKKKKFEERSQYQKVKGFKTKKRQEIKSEKEKGPTTYEQKMKPTVSHKVPDEKNVTPLKTSAFQAIHNQRLKQENELNSLINTLRNGQRQIQEYMIQVDELLPYKTKSIALQNEVNRLEHELEEQKQTVDELRNKEAELTRNAKKSSELRVKLEMQVVSLQEKNDALMNLNDLRKEPALHTSKTLDHKVTKSIDLQKSEHEKKTTENKLMTLQCMVTDLKNKMTLQESSYKTVLAEKDDLRCKLAKAQENIKLNERTIHVQKENLRKQEKGLQRMTTELSQLKCHNTTLVTKLVKVKKSEKEAEMSKNALLLKEANSEKKQLLNDRNFAALKDEKEKLEKELEHYKQLTTQHQSKITTLEEVNDAQELKLREYYRALNATKLELEKRIGGVHCSGSS